VITTIAGSGTDDYDGDEKPATEAALNTPSAVAAAPNGDIYIADTLNYRIRMVDHITGLIHTVAGDGSAADDIRDSRVGDGGQATVAHLNMPSDVELAPNGDIYIADMHHQRIRKVDAKSRIITTVAGSGQWGHTGDGGRAIDASLAGPAGLAIVPDGPNGSLTLYIADYYNGRLRAVDSDGIIHDVGSAERLTFGAPTRVAYAADRGSLWIADASRDKLVNLKLRSDAVLARRPASPTIQAPAPGPPKRAS
jgi:sugar lactone lactonase YvrE